MLGLINHGKQLHSPDAFMPRFSRMLYLAYINLRSGWPTKIHNFCTSIRKLSVTLSSQQLGLAKPLPGSESGFSVTALCSDVYCGCSDMPSTVSSTGTECGRRNTWLKECLSSQGGGFSLYNFIKRTILARTL